VDPGWLGIIELVLVLGIALVLGIWELVSLRRAKRRAAAAERSSSGVAPRE
jgi:hypothetical protein